MDLFTHSAQRHHIGQPLAERMRPHTISEFVGQTHLLAAGKLLHRLLAEDSPKSTIPSLILWGPPGSGKTTLARLLAQALGVRFHTLSATQSGVKEVRQEIDAAHEALSHFEKRTMLFIDELHRFHKGQQDALLPHVESGTIILVGATTENPSFEINAALLSRCRVLRLEPLARADLITLLERALRDGQRGLGSMQVVAPREALELIAEQASGDARRALSTLEACVQVAVPDPHGVRRIDEVVVEQAVQKRVLLYDKAGDEHYAVISAFIKSMRGSDPDAAVYWLMRLLEAGEDPLFVLRRMVIFAAEDIGCADPRALMLATATVEAFRFVGMPEGVLPMSQLALYLSCAPKSNTALTASANAREAVHRHGSLPVPAHLRNPSNRMARMLGHGADYRYPHDFPDHHVDEHYLPDALQGQCFYHPSESGYERTQRDRLLHLRKG